MTRAARILVTGLFAGSLALGCAKPTQLVVVVDTNLEVPVELDLVEVAVTGPSGVRTVTPQALAGADARRLPLTLGVAPAADSLGPVDVSAVGKLGGEVVVSTTARVTLVAGETRTLHLVLVRGCAGRTCEGGRACRPGGCAATEIDDLPVWDGEVPDFVETDPCDGAEWDVDGDGDGSVECGGGDCDDDEPRAFTGAVEECDRVDNDCDGVTDPDCQCAPHGDLGECSTSCGSVGERTCLAGIWGECQLREESCNGVDDDCDGATDEGFLYAPLLEARVTDDPADSVDPRLLFVGGRWSLVWTDAITERGIYFAALGDDGAPVVAPTMLVEDAGGRADFAWSGSEFGLAWVRRDSSSGCCGTDCTMTCTTQSDRLLGMVFGPDGSVVSPRVRIDDDVDLDPRVRLVHDGVSFAMTYHDGDLYLRRFGADGVVIGDREPLSAPHDAVADMVWTGTHYALAFARNDEAYFLRADMTGIEEAEVLVATSNRTRGAALDWTGSGFVEAWLYQDDLLSNQVGLQIAALDETGASRSMMFETLSTSLGGGGLGGPDAEPPSVRAAPGQVLVTWSDQRDMDKEIYFARISPSGAILQPATRLTTSVGAADGTSIAWGGESFGVAWHDGRNESSEIYFSRVGCAPP